jgi:CHASE2 domain-containing sensor protein
MSRFRNKIVFIGYEAGDEHVTPSGKRYGAEILANAVSNILQHTFVRAPPLLNHYLIILIMILIGALLPLWFGAWMVYTLPLKLPVFSDARVPVPVTLIAVTIVYIFIAIMVYKLQRTVLNMSYHIAALFLAYLLTSTIRTRLGFK